MFSSPAIRISSTENTNNMIMKKPGEVTTSKKPFADRSVNRQESAVTAVISKPNVKSQEVDSVFDKIMQEIEYDGCSYLNHESDDLFGIYPKQTFLNKELILNILSSHCTYPDLEIPYLEMEENDDFLPPSMKHDWDEGLNDDILLSEESVDDIVLPEESFNLSDISF